METKSLRALLACWFVLLPASAASAQAPREFGAATFLAPSGWSVDAGPNLQTFTVVRGGTRCLLAISAEQAASPKLETAFATAWSSLFSSYRRAVQPSAREQVSPAGYRHAVGQAELEDAAGNRLLARLHVFPLGAKSQWIVLIANGPEAFAACGKDFEAFFTSLRFPSRSASLPDSGSPPPPNPEPGSADSPQQFGNLTFVPPPGWAVRRGDGLVQLSATGTRGPEALEVLLLPGRVSSASLEHEAALIWEEIQARLGAELLRNVSGRAFDLDQPARSLAGIDYLKGNGGMRTAAGEWDVDVYALRAGDRVECVAVIARAFTEQLTRVTTARNPRFAREIRRLVFTLRFANLPGPPPAPAGLRPGGIVGVWAGLGMSFGTIKTELAVFFDNGMAYFGPSLPLEGLDGIDPVAEQPEHQRDWGTYTWSGSEGVLTLPYGNIAMRSIGSILELTTNRTPHRFLKLVLPPNGRLDGTWCYSDGQCLRFTPDGRFQDNGAVRVAEHSLYAWPQAPAGGAGRYTLRNYTLQLAYNGGAELRVAFPGMADGGSSPTELRLGWNVDLLTRR